MQRESDNRASASERVLCLLTFLKQNTYLLPGKHEDAVSALTACSVPPPGLIQAGGDRTEHRLAGRDRGPTASQRQHSAGGSKALSAQSKTKGKGHFLSCF